MYLQNEQNLHNLSKHEIHLRTDLNSMYFNDFVYLPWSVTACCIRYLEFLSHVVLSVFLVSHRSILQHPFRNEIRLQISLLLTSQPFSSPLPIAGTTPSECPGLAVFMLSCCCHQTAS